ncbi:histidinol dehydrogenase [Siculibacillus lacustris]|uniref:Histidinol dehydrogenase n=1 Tax=Siculibacillus lacustris TaxID=1549641 RepID=A0A4Q9VEQ6_9HYPH|nr:type II toxin-antitoxin system VapB family antitoxin [Siculibacillus lacustris]TBW32691.1 histidinol dehydrogenase [Siculibacillus lacustris]
MPLYIRDDTVDALAVRLQQATHAPNKTEAVRRALTNELVRLAESVPLRMRIGNIQKRVRARMGPNSGTGDAAPIADVGEP